MSTRERILDYVTKYWIVFYSPDKKELKCPLIPLTRRALIGLKEELEKLEGIIEVKYLEARD